MKVCKTVLCVMLFSIGIAPGAELFVSLSSPGPVEPYGSWDTAATNIQTAIDFSTDGDTIRIAPGTYTRQSNSKAWIDSRSAVVSVNKFIKLIGDSDNRDDVIIDGEGLYRGMVIYHTTTTEQEPVLVQHLTIKNGYAPNGGGIFVRHGQNLVTNEWLAVFDNCEVSSNTATNIGAGVYTYRYDTTYKDFALLFSNTVFSSNIVTNNSLATSARGAGVHVNTIYKESRVKLANCTLEDNWAPESTGINIQSGSVIVENSIFRNNHAALFINAASGGGGIFVWTDGYLDVRNSLFVNNKAAVSTHGGGAIAIQSQGRNDNVEIRNCTFWGNTHYAIYERNWKDQIKYPDLRIWNSIFYNNPDGDLFFSIADYATNYLYNCSFGTEPSGANKIKENVITGDPLFVDPENGDFRLRGSSPAAGSGIYESWMDGARDLAGNPRITPGAGVDMGAYAFRPSGALLILR